MASAFTPSEREHIITQLREAAWRHAGAEGMRKTSVDVLATEAGISKGALYHFYASKELLFLDMLEDWQKKAYAVAEQVMAENASLPWQERASLAFRATFRAILSRPIIKFLVDEAQVMLRRIPQDALEKHYHTQHEFIIGILRHLNVVLTVPDDTAVAAINILMLSLVHAENIGPSYDQGIEALIDSACRQLIAG